ncbi:MAG: hypothetical protein Q7S68_00670 [Deltaproteobacteria bacterium]|nr:hypothetical protein [Deltaproteobacteria bacterium]
MNRFKQMGILWTGMALALVVTSVAAYLVWTHLINREAIHYGSDLSRRLRNVVIQIDKETKSTFTPELFKELHHKTLGQIPLVKVEPIREYVKKLSNIVRNPEGGVSFYTDCPNPDKAECYDDFLFGVENKIYRKGYNPESRPWYIGAKTHTDWIVLDYVTTKKKISGYPNAWSIAVVKRLVQENDREGEGIWIAVTTSNYSQIDPTSPFPSTYILNMLFAGQKPPFDQFDLYFRALRFPNASLDSTPFSNPCGAITELHGLTYTANTQCQIEEQPIQFFFTKHYDHPWHLWLLLATALLLLYGAYVFFHFVNRLQRQNIEQNITNAIGAKLVHDLKKGILSQLNKLFEDGEQNLDHHFKYLNLLNKYIHLLNNNLRREKELSWIPLTPTSFKNYLELVLGPAPIKEETLNGQGPFLEMTFSREIHLKTGGTWPFFKVPEISFYRILKNIFENFNTHGVGELRITFSKDENGIELIAQNRIEKTGKDKTHSTQLGLLIIRQLLEDNFGTQTQIKQEEEGDGYVLKLRFPLIGEGT